MKLLRKVHQEHGTLPKIHPGKWEQFIYYLNEPFWSTVWYRHNGRIHGDLPDEPLIFLANHGSYLDWLATTLQRACKVDAYYQLTKAAFSHSRTVSQAGENKSGFDFNVSMSLNRNNPRP